MLMAKEWGCAQEQLELLGEEWIETAIGGHSAMLTDRDGSKLVATSVILKRATQWMVPTKEWRSLVYEHDGAKHFRPQIPHILHSAAVRVQQW